MPRPAKGPRLYLRERSGREPTWVIRDGTIEVRTGCSAGDCGGAEKALGKYLTDKYVPPKTGGELGLTLIADVMTVYLKEHAPTRPDGGVWLSYMAAPIIVWWNGRTLLDVKAKTCVDYKDHRIGQGVKDATARHELKTLKAAINYYHKNHGPLTAVPVVTLPPKPSRRVDYFLTRSHVAKRLWEARRKGKRWRHLARVILIGVYSGTRPGATREARWVPSTRGGWFDLESETYHRAPQGHIQSKKRQPPSRIHRRLLPHLRRWKRLDEANGITHVIHYYGKPTGRVDTAWDSLTRACGQKHDGPHICRHTAATWQMQSGTDPYEAAGFLGMSVETLLEVYGHHHPNFQGKAASASGKRAKA